MKLHEEFKLYETMWDEKYPHGSDLISGEYEEIPNNYQVDTKPHGKWILAYNNGNNWVFYNRLNSFSDNLDKAVRYESRMDALYNKDKANKKYKEETGYRANFIAVKEDSKRLTEAGGNSKKAYKAMMKVQGYIESTLGWTIIDCQQDDEYSMMLYCNGSWDIEKIETLKDVAADVDVEISIVSNAKSSYDYRVYLSY